MLPSLIARRQSTALNYSSSISLNLTPERRGTASFAKAKIKVWVKFKHHYYWQRLGILMVIALPLVFAFDEVWFNKDLLS